MNWQTYYAINAEKREREMKEQRENTWRLLDAANEAGDLALAADLAADLGELSSN